MRRASTLAMLFIAAVIGFALGRATGSGDLALPSNANFPLLPAPPKTAAYVAQPVAEREVVIETPAEGAAVSFPAFEITGRAKYAEGATISAMIESPMGEIRAESGELRAPLEGNYGRFSATIGLDGWSPGRATLTVTMLSGDGKELGSDVRTISVADDRISVEVFFPNDRMSVGSDCSAVFPVTRQVSSATNVYRSTLEQLLAGPTADEKAGGYGTTIPSGARLKSVAADAEGVVRADFATTLDRGVGGSCRVTAIRAQITRSLGQFPEVRDVILSVNGRTEGILQP